MYRTFLVPLDGSRLAECVLPHVEALAQCGQVKLVLLSQVATPLVPHAGTIELDENLVREVEAAHKEAADDYLKKAAAQLVVPHGVHVETRVLAGDAAGALTDFAKEREVDLIVMATHGRSGLGRWVMGSVADRILRSSDVPVLLIRASRH